MKYGVKRRCACNEQICKCRVITQYQDPLFDFYDVASNGNVKHVSHRLDQIRNKYGKDIVLDARKYCSDYNGKEIDLLLVGFINKKCGDNHEY